jgi:hypothetical protein
MIVRERVGPCAQYAMAHPGSSCIERQTIISPAGVGGRPWCLLVRGCGPGSGPPQRLFCQLLHDSTTAANGGPG